MKTIQRKSRRAIAQRRNLTPPLFHLLSPAEFKQARAIAYEAVGQIRFPGAHYRRDIALKATK